MEILRGVSVEVARGELVAVVGPNGAGKSTLFKALMGLIVPSAGTVTYRGEPITGIRTDLLVKKGIGYVPQGRVVFPRMTVSENLSLGAFSERDKRRLDAARDRVLTIFPELRDRLGRRAGLLSGGEQQMLAMGRALMSAPNLLLLDEPSLGLSPRYVSVVFTKLADLKAHDLAVLLVEQNATRALEASDRGYVLDMGEVRFQGPGPALLQSPEVQALYLGVT
ncbi:MAG: ABC transporter ATP-binding protein [Candidatus Rokubacteria bacterium]|nr:ABC transporter ATP-binding protein [Candidatus Rokubacteria bacterium]